MSETNRELNDCLVGLVAGEESYAQELYTILTKSFVTFVLSRVGEQEVKDTLHDIYLKVIRNARKYRPNTNAIGWIATLANHVILDKKRAIQRRKEVCYDEITSNIGTYDEDLLELEDMLNGLTKEERQIVILRSMGYTYEELGKMLKKHVSVIAYRIKIIRVKTVKFNKIYQKYTE